jgi:hypothetical protein
LSLLDSSGTGLAYANADDLVHLAPSIEAQQRQVDLMYGFCAFTGLEISLSKVEAISINYARMLHDTPFLRLRDWHWRPHSVQHQDDGYWTRYLGLYLDKHSCSKQFRAAKLKVKMLCHLIASEIAPPEITDTLPGGSGTLGDDPTIQRTGQNTDSFAPPSLVPTKMFSHRPHLCPRRSRWMWGDTHQRHCAASEMAISLLPGTLRQYASTALIRRDLAAGPTDPSSFCTSLVEWD